MQTSAVTSQSMVIPTSGENENAIRNNGKRSVEVNQKRPRLEKTNSVLYHDSGLLKKLLYLNDRKKTKYKIVGRDIENIYETRLIDWAKEAESKSREKESDRKFWSTWETRLRKRNVSPDPRREDDNRASHEGADVSQESAHTDCLHPEYLVYTWVLSLIALATTLKLYFLIKTLLALSMVAVYSLFILVFYPEVFSNVHSHAT